MSHLVFSAMYSSVLADPVIVLSSMDSILQCDGLPPGYGCSLAMLLLAYPIVFPAQGDLDCFVVVNVLVRRGRRDVGVD